MSTATEQQQTPSPVRQVRAYEKDMEIAKKLQQMYDDERRAVEMEEEMKVEDEFDAATREFEQKQSEQFINKLMEKEGVTAQELAAAEKQATR